ASLHALLVELVSSPPTPEASCATPALRARTLCSRSVETPRARRALMVPPACAPSLLLARAQTRARSARPEPSPILLPLPVPRALSALPVLRRLHRRQPLACSALLVSSPRSSASRALARLAVREPSQPLVPANARTATLVRSPLSPERLPACSAASVS